MNDPAKRVKQHVTDFYRQSQSATRMLLEYFKELEKKGWVYNPDRRCYVNPNLPGQEIWVEA